MADEKHVVIGFTGGLGRAVAKALSENKKSVIAFARDKAKSEKYAQGLSGITLVQGDANNPEDVKRVTAGATHVYYCVNVPYQRWYKEAKPLLAVSLNAAVDAKAKFVFPGNVYVYGKPQFSPVNEGHPHAAQTKKGKIRIDMESMILDAHKKHGLCYTIVRLPDFYGPFVINGFTEQIFINALKGKTLKWYGKKKSAYECIYIEDAGKAMVIAGNSSKADSMQFNVPGCAPTTAVELLKLISQTAGKGVSCSFTQSEAIVTFFGFFNEGAREFSEMMYLRTKELILDGGLFKTTFNSLPTRPYNEGIKSTLDWIKAYFL